MKSSIVSIATVTLIAASAGLLSAQSVTKPGQIATASEVIVSPNSSSSYGSVEAIPSAPPRIEDHHAKVVNRIWISSMLAMVGGTSFDAGSSWGKRESNPLLASQNGTFGAKGFSIKLGVAAGIIIPEVLLRHHQSLKSMFAVGNFGESAIFTGAAIHNMTISQKP